MNDVCHFLLTCGIWKREFSRGRLIQSHLCIANDYTYSTIRCRLNGTAHGFTMLRPTTTDVIPIVRIRRKSRIQSVRLFDVQVHTIRELIVHFQSPFFRLRSLNGDPLGLLPRGGLGISDGQNPILHRGLDILGLRNPSDSPPVRKASVLVAHLGAFWQPDVPSEPAVSALLDRVSLFLLLGRRAILSRDGEVPVLNVDLDVVLGETRQFKRRSHEVLVRAFQQVHPAPQESATEH